MKTALPLLTLLGVALCVATSHAQVSEQDSLALVALFHATGGEHWVRQTDPQSAGSWRTGPNWLNGPVNTWHSVEVTDGRVTKIYTELLFMQGELPPELGDLTGLTELFITHDHLTGAIPEEIGNLSNLRHLGIYGTHIDAPLPATLGQLTELEHLDLPFNSLTGPIPPELGALHKLEDVHLMENNLEGMLPNELAQLERLRVLALSDNPNLHGPLPVGLMHLPQLRNVRIDNTGICGPLDPAFQDWLQHVARIRQTDCTPTPTETYDIPATFRIISIYPNPVSNQLNIRWELPISDAVDIEIIDLLGRRVYSTTVIDEQLGTREITLDLPRLTPGMYLLRLFSVHQAATEMLVVGDS